MSVNWRKSNGGLFEILRQKDNNLLMILRGAAMNKNIAVVAVSLILAISLVLGGCTAAAPAAEKAVTPRTVNWRMATSWPADMYYYQAGAKAVCDRVRVMSGGKFIITPYPAGSLMGAFDVFDAVSSGKVECMHSWPGYWRSKELAAELFSSIPNQMMTLEWAVWLYGPARGIDLWKELYAKYNIVPFPGGLVGPEFGFFTTKPVRTLDDFKGMKLRVSGLAADVMKELGATAVLLPADQIVAAMQKGEIDGFEFSAPYVDWPMGFEKVAKNVVLPSWHQPSAMFEIGVNAAAWKALPEDYQAIFEAACKEISMVDLMAMQEGSNAAYKRKYENAGVTITVLDFEAIKTISTITDRLADEQAAKDPFFAKVLKSQRDFRSDYRTWELWGDYNMYPEKR
jgi:TRAP-type mannitol/chloroaromatic compound transport system substrate-binding protein